MEIDGRSQALSSQQKREFTMLHEPLDFRDKVVLINADDNSISSAIGAGFIAAGARVMISGPAAASEGAIAEACFRPCDADDYPRMQACVDELISGHRRLDVLICVAGDQARSSDDGKEALSDDETITRMLVAPINLAQIAYQAMRRQAEGGVIINVTGTDTPTVVREGAARAAAARGLANLATSLAVEWGPAVRVNTILVARPSPPDPAMPGVTPIPNEIPGRRHADQQLADAPGELVNACLFLASSLAAYISGSHLELHCH
jgi:NAD(P)-dependent dehydrogenase (short-subunit alcohol dehydrogenase family)